MKSRFIQEALEVDMAVEMVQKEDSTDPDDLATVASYKEELEKNRDEAAAAADDGFGGDDTTTDGDGTEGGEDGAPGGVDTTATGDEPAGEQPTGDGESASGSDEQPASEESDEPVADEDVLESNGEEPIEPTKEAMEALHEACSVYAMVAKAKGLALEGMETTGLTYRQSKQMVAMIDVCYTRMGMVSRNKVSLEDYDGVTAATRNTSAVMEALDERLQRLWDAIKRFFAGVMEWVRDYLITDIHSARRQKAEVMAAQKAAEKKAQEVADANAASLERALLTPYRSSSRQIVPDNNEVQKLSELQPCFDELVKVISDVSQLVGTAASKKLVSLYTDLNADPPYAESDHRIFRVADVAGEALKLQEGMQGKPNLALVSSGVLPGGGKVRITVGADGTSAENVDINTQLFQLQRQVPASATLFFTQDFKEIQNFMKMVGAVSDQRIKLTERIKLVQRGLDASLGKILKSNPVVLWPNATDMERARAVLAAQMSLRTFTNIVTSGAKQTSDYANSVITASLGFINANTAVLTKHSNPSI